MSNIDYSIHCPEMLCASAEIEAEKGRQKGLCKETAPISGSAGHVQRKDKEKQRVGKRMADPEPDEERPPSPRRAVGRSRGPIHDPHEMLLWCQNSDPNAPLYWPTIEEFWGRMLQNGWMLQVQV